MRPRDANETADEHPLIESSPLVALNVSAAAADTDENGFMTREFTNYEKVGSSRRRKAIAKQ
jgi:hypothetical protein